MPVEAIKKLQQIIVPRIIHRFSNGKIYIKETKKNAVFKDLAINGINDECIAINLDEVGLANKILQNSKGLKSCDAVIFCHLDNQGYILILEMKSSIPSETEKDKDSPIWQLKAGNCLVDYLLSVLENFEEIKVTNEWQRRYFIFHCGNNKRTTLPDYAENPPNNNRADKAHILCVSNGDVVPLLKLLNKPL